MKTFLLVSLSLLLFSACRPAAPEAQTQPLPGSEIFTLRTSLTPRNVSQASQLAVSQPASANLPQPLLEILDVAARRRSDLAGQVGWLHLWTRNAQSRSNPLSPLAPGLSQFEQDQWLEMDGNGQVQKAVYKIMNENGDILQINIRKGSAWVNLTLGAQGQIEDLVRFDPNYGFDELAAHLVKQGSTINKSILYRDCWYQGEKYTIRDEQLTYEAVYDTGYGDLRSIKTWRVAQNGEVSLVESLEVLLEERVPQPPAEVLALLEQVPGSP